MHGSVHRVTTAAGSEVCVDNRVGAAGSAAPHGVTGWVDGEQRYWALWLHPRDVAGAVRAAEAAGWAGVNAGPQMV